MLESCLKDQAKNPQDSHILPLGGGNLKEGCKLLPRLVEEQIRRKTGKVNPDHFHGHFPWTPLWGRLDSFGKQRNSIFCGTWWRTRGVKFRFRLLSTSPMGCHGCFTHSADMITCTILGNGRNTVSRVLFWRRGLTEPH